MNYCIVINHDNKSMVLESLRKTEYYDSKRVVVYGLDNALAFRDDLLDRVQRKGIDVSFEIGLTECQELKQGNWPNHECAMQMYSPEFMEWAADRVADALVRYSIGKALG